MAHKQMDLFWVIVAICVSPVSMQSAPERRLIDQINNVRNDLGYVLSDISTLFKSVENMNKTILSKECEHPGTKNKIGEERDMTLADKLSNGVDSVEIMALKEAFESEKRLNRHLQSELIDVKNGLESVQETLQILTSSFKAERAQNEELKARLEVEARKYNEVNDQVKDLTERNSDFEVSMEQINIQHQLELEAMKERISSIQKEIADNVTSIIEASDCTCKQTTTGAMLLTDHTTEQEITTVGVQTLQSCERLPSGVYDIYLNSLESPKTVYCDADTDGGGWLVITRRQNGFLDFDRKWSEYKNGFGNVTGDFWIGNDFIHELTKSKPMELRIDMEDIDGNKAFAKYDVFKIGSEAEKYVLTVGGYSGTAGDSLEKTTFDLHSHNGMRFTTIDSDNDRDDDANCAGQFTGGWWYNDCFASHLTGIYERSHSVSWFRGIIWETWTGWNKPLTFVEMKVR